MIKIHILKYVFHRKKWGFELRYAIAGINVPLDTPPVICRIINGWDDPTNSLISLKNNGKSTMSMANPTRLSSPKVKNVV